MIFTSRRTALVAALFIIALFLVIGFIIYGAIPNLKDEKTPVHGETIANGEVNPGEGSGKEEEGTVVTEETGSVSGKPPIGIKGEQTSSDDDFFANYRLDRERVRGHQVELLQEVINDPNSDAGMRKEAQDRLIQISERMDKELQLEALIKAKGFTEAALFIQPESATAILEKDGMAESDVAVVADMISRVTGYKLEDIVVIPK
jgi:stage III sporulation protein AH